MISKKWLQMVGVAGALSLGLAACGDGGTDVEGEEGEDGGGSELSGTIAMDGSSTVGPLSEVAAELFMEENPDVEVTVAISGTGGGFEQFCAGETDMNNASREISDEEAAICEENEIAYENVQVANDALSVVINQDNPIDCLTVDQINQIWDEGSEVSTWGDVDGDIPEEIGDGEITLYGPGTDSGTFDYFTEAINGEEGRIRTDYTDIGEDDNAAVVGVEGDENAMAYIPYSYLQESLEQVKPVQIDDGSGCTEATAENVQAGEYTPLGRPLFTYASDVALEREETVAFMEFYIENSEEIAEAASYIGLNEDQAGASQEQIESLVG